MKTTAAVLTEINQPLQIEELTIPPLKKGQVLVEITYSGICHSQLNEIEGKKGPDKFLPHTLGHEGAGVVEETGPDVTKVKSGDHVVLTWIKGEGADVPSTVYSNDNGSKVNSGAISTFMTRTVVSENRLIAIPKEMPLKEAALLGCAIPTGAGIILNTIKPKPESSLVVFGVGGIGMSVVVAAKAASCKRIIAIDVHKQKLQLARQMGATEIINAKKEEPLSVIMELTDGEGADYAVESAGLKKTMEMAFMSVKDNGGLLVIAGNLSHNEKISISPFDLIKGKRIIGTWGGETIPDRDIPKYVRLYLKGKLDLDSLITHRFSLDHINRAMETFRNEDNALRILIEC